MTHSVLAVYPGTTRPAELAHLLERGALRQRQVHPVLHLHLRDVGVGVERALGVDPAEHLARAKGAPSSTKRSRRRWTRWSATDGR